MEVEIPDLKFKKFYADAGSHRDGYVPAKHAAVSRVAKQLLDVPSLKERWYDALISALLTLRKHSAHFEE